MKDKINILFVVLSLDIGGLEILLLEFLKSLNRNRYNPAVCVLQAGGGLIDEIKLLDIPVYVIPKKNGIDCTLPFKLRKLIKDKNIHIVHTHNSTPWIYAGIAIKWLKNTRLIHTKHSNLNLNQKKLIKAENCLAQKTDYIIADSQDVSDFMIEKEKIIPTKIKLIPNGVDTRRFNNLNRQTKPGKKVVATVGRLVEIKDQISLLTAFKTITQEFPSSELWLIGEGPLKEKLEKFSQTSGLDMQVKFLGNRRDIPEVLKQVDVFVLSSLDEGLSISLLEAMASGIPAVVTRVGGNPEIVQENQNGFLVEPRSPETLANRIMKLLSDDALAKRLGENGRNRVIKDFSIATMTQKYSLLYERLLQREKICIVGEFPPPEGGMAIQAQLLMQKLQEQGNRINSLKRNYVFKGLLSWIGKIKIIRSILRFIIFKIKLLNMVFKVDVFYIFSNSFLNFYLYTLPPVWLGKLFKRNILVSFHGGAAEKFLNKPGNFLCRATLRIADYIIVPSGYLRDIFSKFGLTTVIIPNMIDFQHFVFKKRGKLQPNFIVTRHLEPEYNTAMIIKAFSLVLKNRPEAKLRILGNGSEKDKLQKIAQELHLGNSVEFLGEVKNKEIIGLYNQSDILLNGSNVDNLPVSILEAFACGLPVVSTRAGGIPYLVEHEKTGLLVELDNPEAMSASIFRLLENPELAQTLVENAKVSLEKYSWANIWPKLLPLLKKRQKIPLNVKIYQNIIFPIFDLLRGRKNLRKLQFLRKSQYWPKETIENWQLKKINELIAIAKEKSPFYQERLRNIKLPLSNLSDLQDIPILTKKDIRKNKEDIKCKGVPESLFIPGKTGGSTGEPMNYYYDKRGRDWNRGSVYRSQEWAETYLGEKNIQMTGSHYDFTEFKKIKWKIIFWLQRYKSLPVSFLNKDLLEEYYHEILKYKPTSIWGYSSGIYHFAKFIEEKHKNTDFGFIKAIVTSSENLFDFQRKKINDVFGDNKVYDHYGSREIYIASECNIHKGYHIHSEVVLVEIVDKDNKHKKPGELGRVLITDLSNQVFPFIRYEIGDVGSLSSEENCPCGIMLPKIEKIEGRIADVVVLPDRILTPPNFTILLSDYEGIEQYQIIQKNETELKLNIVKNDAFKQEYERYIKKSLAKLAGENINIKLEYVDEINIPASGKRRYIISEVSQEQM